jgi:hypothetical protein
MRKTIAPIATIGMLAVLAGAMIGCATYDRRYQYLPRPLDVPVAMAGRDDRAATVLVTVAGVRKPDVEAGIPASVEVRLRVENHSDADVALEPATFKLFTAGLEEFPPPVVPGGTLVVAPGETGSLVAYFPFPGGAVPGAYDLDGLNARWTLAVGDAPTTASATFTRQREDRYDDYRFGIGFPVLIYSHYHVGRGHRGVRAPHHHPRPGGRIH